MFELHHHEQNTADLGTVLVTTESPAATYEILLDRLTYDPVAFVYRKKDGTMRYALGTLNSDLIPDVGKEKWLETKVHRIENLLQLGERGGFDEDGSVLSELWGPIKGLVKEQRQAPATRKEHPDYQNYWDFAAKGWRQFKKDSVVAILHFST